MDGYRSMLRQIMRFCCLSLLILLLGLPTWTQDVTARGEDAFSTDDGTLIVHVAVPRGQIIQEARLSHSDLAEAVVLRPDPEPLREVRWFILDASGEMLNAAPFVKDAIQRFISADNPRISYGVIVFDSRARILVPPTRDSAALIRELDSYSGTAGQVGCVGDALVALRTLSRSPDEARRVLLVVGPLTRQGTCSESAVQSISVPIDVIVIADDVDGAYLDIAERSQGMLKRANLQTVSARFEEVKTQWLQPIYALRGRSPQPIGGQSSLRVQFTDSSSLPALVRVSSILLTPTPVGPSLQRPSTATPPPADVSAPTVVIAPAFTSPPIVAELPSLAPTMMMATLAPPTETPIAVALLSSDTPFVPPILSDAPLLSFTPLPMGQPLSQPTSAVARPSRVTFTPRFTDPPAPSNTPAPPSEERAVPEIIPSDTPPPPNNAGVAGEVASSTPVSLAVVPTQAESASADESAFADDQAAPADEPAQPVPQEASTPQDLLTNLIAQLTAANPLILVGGGLALLAVLIGVVGLLSLGRQQHSEPVQRVDPKLDVTIAYHDPVQPTSDSSGLDFYSGSAKPLSKEELRRQVQQRPLAYDDVPPTPGPMPRPAQGYADEDDLVLTSVLEDSDFQQMQAQSGGEVVAWLRLDSKPPKDYELRAAGLTIGRKANNDIVVTGDNAISGQHARLEVSADGGVTLVVVSKTNPVVISGVMLRENERRALRSQDVIQLSPNTRLIFIARQGDQASFDEEVTLL